MGSLEKAYRTVSTEHVEGWVDSQVLPISTPDVVNCRACFEFIQKFLYFRPGLVASVRKVRCYFVVDFIDMFLLEFQWQRLVFLGSFFHFRLFHCPFLILGAFRLILLHFFYYNDSTHSTKSTDSQQPFECIHIYQYSSRITFKVQLRILILL